MPNVDVNILFGQSSSLGGGGSGGSAPTMKTTKPPKWGRSFSASGGAEWKNPTPFGNSNGKYLKHGYDGMGGTHSLRGGTMLGSRQNSVSSRRLKPTSAIQVATQVKRGSKRSFTAAAKAVASVVGGNGRSKLKQPKNSIANFFAGVQ